MPATELAGDPRSRSVVLGKANLLLAVLGLLLLAGAYWVNLLPEALALMVLALLLATLISRVRHARRGELEYGLLRSPFRRELRPVLLQCLNHWIFWALFSAALVAGTFAIVPAQIDSLLDLPLPDRIPYPPLLVMLGAAALVLAGSAVVPRRRVQVPTNVAMAIGSVFLAVQLVRIYLPPAGAVVLEHPMAGNWDVVAGGRSVLVSHHYSIATPNVADALDLVQLVDGRGHDGRPEHADSWYGFGEPVLAPAAGTVVRVSDTLPDEPIGATGVTPPYGNHIVLDLGDGRYAVLAHLAQGSAQVSRGERVAPGRPIAAVGDSGNSLWPHLHLHVQNSPDLDDRARTVPIVFRDVTLTRNGRSSTPGRADLRRGDHLRVFDS